MIQQLTGLDAAFLYGESGDQPGHGIGLAVAELPPDNSGDVMNHIRTYMDPRMSAMPGLRRRIRFVPLGLDHPYLVDDPDFDLDTHLTHVVLDPPGDERRLMEVVAGAASQEMARTGPLWDVTVIEGLAGRRIAFLMRVHHCLTDGVSGMAAMASLCDLEALAPDAPAAAVDGSAGSVTRLEMLARAIPAVATRPIRRALAVSGTVLGLAHALVGPPQGGMARRTILRAAPRTSLNGIIGRDRTVARTNVPTARLRTVADRFGATLNEVVLAVVAGVLRNHLGARDDLPLRPLVAAVPVSLHDGVDEPGAFNAGANRVSTMLVPLATHLADPAERVEFARQASELAKAFHSDAGSDLLGMWAEILSARSLGNTMRLWRRAGLSRALLPFGNVVVSNVPGSPIPLYTAGERLASIHLFGPLLDGIGLNVTVTSYADAFAFGLVASRDLVDDIEGLATGIDAEARRLAAATPTGSRLFRRAPAPRPHTRGTAVASNDGAPAMQDGQRAHGAAARRPKVAG